MPSAAMNRIVVVTLSSLTPVLAAASPDWFNSSAAQRQISSIQQRSIAPGLSAAICSVDRVGVGTAVSGVRRASGGDLVRASDRFHIGSNTKAFSAQIAAAAVDSGLISWDSTIGQMLGQEIQVDASYADVTLRQLLTHTAGTPPFSALEDWGPLYDLQGTASEQRLELARAVLSQPRAVPSDAPAGERYSNAGYSIAATMVERATGRSWESMVDYTFNQSMGLQVAVGAPGYTDGTTQPSGHIFVDGSVVEVGPTPGLPDAMSPAGNLNMTVSSLAEFGMQHLRALRGLDNTLGLTDVAVAALHDTSFGGGPYAMGWFDVDAPGVEFFGFGHDGSTTAFDSLLLVDTANGLSIAVASNGTLTGDEIGGSLIEAALAMRAAVIPSPATALPLGLALGIASARRRR